VGVTAVVVPSALVTVVVLAGSVAVSPAATANEGVIAAAQMAATQSADEIDLCIPEYPFTTTVPARNQHYR